MASADRTSTRPGGRPRVRDAGALSARVQISLSDRILTRIDRHCVALWQASPGGTVPMRGAVIRAALERMEARLREGDAGLRASFGPGRRYGPSGADRLDDLDAAEERVTYHTKVRMLPSTRDALERLSEELAAGTFRFSRAALIRALIDDYLDAEETTAGGSSSPTPFHPHGGASTNT